MRCREVRGGKGAGQKMEGWGGWEGRDGAFFVNMVVFFFFFGSGRALCWEKVVLFYPISGLIFFIKKKKKTHCDLNSSLFFGHYLAHHGQMRCTYNGDVTWPSPVLH